MPNRNALFARPNLLLPGTLKRRLLFTLYPEKAHSSGFPAFYDPCTPRDFRALAAEMGLTVREEEHFFYSSEPLLRSCTLCNAATVDGPGFCTSDDSLLQWHGRVPGDRPLQVARSCGDVRTRHHAPIAARLTLRLDRQRLLPGRSRRHVLCFLDARHP